MFALNGIHREQCNQSCLPDTRMFSSAIFIKAMLGEFNSLIGCDCSHVLRLTREENEFYVVRLDAREEARKQRETTEQSHANVLQPQPEQCISHVRTISRSFHLQYSQKPCFKMSILIHLFDAFDDFFACGMRGHEKRFFGEIAQLDNLPTLERVNEHMTLPTQGLTWPVNTRLDARNTTLLGRKANNKRLRHRRHLASGTGRPHYVIYVIYVGVRYLRWGRGYVIPLGAWSLPGPVRYLR